MKRLQSKVQYRTTLRCYDSVIFLPMFYMSRLVQDRANRMFSEKKADNNWLRTMRKYSK